MSGPEPDLPPYEDLFDADYLAFYDPFLTDDVAEDEANLIVNLSGLRPGCRILDAGCGHGRLCAALHGRGFNVHGVDRVSFFLRVAAERVPPLGGRLVQGDFAALPCRDAAFDAVACWFTAFGLGSDGALRGTLLDFRRVLRPGGQLVLDVPARARLLDRIPSGAPLIDTITLEDGSVLTDATTFDAARERLCTTRTIRRNATVRVLDYTIRLFSPAEMSSWLMTAGFAAPRFVDEHGANLEDGSRRMVATASRVA